MFVLSTTWTRGKIRAARQRGKKISLALDTPAFFSFRRERMSTPFYSALNVLENIRFRNAIYPLTCSFTTFGPVHATSRFVTSRDGRRLPCILPGSIESISVTLMIFRIPTEHTKQQLLFQTDCSSCA
jgi:hypothetical protein